MVLSNFMHHGYTIRNLEADVEFANVTIHSKNRVGYSPPSNVIESVETIYPLHHQNHYFSR